MCVGIAPLPAAIKTTGWQLGMAANLAACVHWEKRTGVVASRVPLGRTALSTQKKQRYSLNSDRLISDSTSNPKL
ncbi:MAG TPA: hypothetical protein DCE39_21580 [Planctomycetaceae bacterium]|nr:hypothetical protein [Planctomycetaceae bacterium]